MVWVLKLFGGLQCETPRSAMLTCIAHWSKGGERENLKPATASACTGADPSEDNPSWPLSRRNEGSAWTPKTGCAISRARSFFPHHNQVLSDWT